MKLQLIEAPVLEYAPSTPRAAWFAGCKAMGMQLMDVGIRGRRLFINPEDLRGSLQYGLYGYVEPRHLFARVK